jgi:hypothetical protein
LFPRVSYRDWDLWATFAVSVSNVHLTLCDDIDTWNGVRDADLDWIFIDKRCKRGYGKESAYWAS